MDKASSTFGVPPEPKKVSFLRYYQNLDAHDRTLMISGLIAAVIAGIIMPSISLVMANIAMAFSG